MLFISRVKTQAWHIALRLPLETDRFNRLMALLILAIILSGILAIAQTEVMAAGVQRPIAAPEGRAQAGEPRAYGSCRSSSVGPSVVFQRTSPFSTAEIWMEASMSWPPSGDRAALTIVPQACLPKSAL